MFGNEVRGIYLWWLMKLNLIILSERTSRGYFSRSCVITVVMVLFEHTIHVIWLYKCPPYRISRVALGQYLDGRKYKYNSIFGSCTTIMASQET
jgi:hypothetical protein